MERNLELGDTTNIYIGLLWLCSIQLIWDHSVHLSQNGLYVENGWSYIETGLKFGLVDTSNTYMGYIWLCMVQAYLGVIWSTCLKVACDSKKTGRRVKRNDI